MSLPNVQVYCQIHCKDNESGELDLEMTRQERKKLNRRQKRAANIPNLISSANLEYIVEREEAMPDNWLNVIYDRKRVTKELRARRFGLLDSPKRQNRSRKAKQGS